MMVRLDLDSAVPPFEQIHTQIAAQARSGALPAGARLPTVRSLAEELGVAPGTVARAYRELEADLIIETRGRHGTFISAGDDATTREAFAAAVAYATRIRRLGLSADDAHHHLDTAFEATGAGAGPACCWSEKPG